MGREDDLSDGVRRSPLPGGAVARAAGMAAAYAAAAYAGRVTVLEGSNLNLTWPAAGVGMLWLMSAGSRRGRLLNAAGLVAVMYALIVPAGVSPAVGLIFALVNLVQVAAAVWLLHRLAPDLWGLGGVESFNTVRNLIALVIATMASSLLTVCLGAAVLWPLVGVIPADTALLWWGRFTGGALAITALGHLWAHRWWRRGHPPGPALARTVAGPLEVTALVVASAAAYLLVFAREDSELSFPLIALSVWAGLRLSPAWACTHSVSVGLIGIVLTLQGRGPFSAFPSPEQQAAFIQLFVALIVVIALVLATGRVEREAVLDQLRTAQRETRARADLWEAVADSMTEGVVVTDADGEVVTTNNAARADMTGRLGSAVDNDRDFPLRRLDGSPLEWDEHPSRRALIEGKVAPHDISVLTADGGRAVVSIAATPVDDIAPYGQGAGAVVVYREVTAERDRADQLAAFAGTAAHDLRAPLTALAGWLELAAAHVQDAPAADPELALMLERADGAAVRMRELIADLLAHATRQEEELELVDLDLRAVLSDVSSLHGLTDELTVGPIPAVHADEGQMRQLLGNLVANAVKYVAPGVRPDIRVTGTAAEGHVHVEVTDNGIGIPEDQRTAVFSKLHRAHTDHPEYVGTGMGLAICRSIVERHGGRISVGPGPGGHGSTFRVTLPAALGAGAGRLRATAAG